MSSFTYVLNQSNANPEKTLFVDDNAKNLMTTKDAGIAHVHQFHNTQNLRKSLTDLSVLSSKKTTVKQPWF